MSTISLEKKAQKISDVLSTDYCAWVNRYVYWLKNPFWLLLLAIMGSLLCGIFLNPLVLVLTALLVMIFGIGVVLPWVAIRGIECRVCFDIPRTRMGTPVLVRLLMKNSLPFPVWGLSLIKGFAQNGSTDGNEGVSLARVPGWSTVEYSWPFQATCRGLYPNATPEVETGFPFGLFRARQTVITSGQLTVWPATVALNGMPDASESQHTEEQFSERRVGEFGDMMGTRLFRAGDSLRRVHWAQTARQQTMIVTERQAPAMTSVKVVLDLSQASHPDSDRKSPRKSTVELAVKTAASLCESLHQQHARVELLLGNQRLVVGDSASSFHQAMDALAVADVEPNEFSVSSRGHGFEILVTTEAGKQTGHAHQILVGHSPTTAWLNVTDDEVFVDELPKLWRGACHAG